VSAGQHGARLRGGGFDVSQVVHCYGDICQVITELAIERHSDISVAEFRTLNRCLDTAIADAVTAHALVTAQTRRADEVEHLGHTAHELRDILNTALLAFRVLRQGAVGVSGSTGTVLGRSLMSLRDVIDRALSEVRIAAGPLRRERLLVIALLDDIAAAGILHSEYRQIEFTIEPVDPNLAVDGDPQLLATAVMNVLHNAFKYTRAGGHVVLRARADEGRLAIEIEDECGGIPDSKQDPFQVFGDRRGSDRSGLGLGLSMARKAVTAHGGDIHIRNVPGKGCTVTIAVPLVAADATAA
jgi:signal transduction histidine kinase